MYFLWQKDADVEKSQTNFMVLVQNLLKNPAERKRFFKVCAVLHVYQGLTCMSKQSVPWMRIHSKRIAINLKIDQFKVLMMSHRHIFPSLQEVFPVQYGTKFDTALQGLTAGLVCKMEQLLPVPNLSQVCVSETLLSFLSWMSDNIEFYGADSKLVPPNWKTLLSSQRIAN